MPSRYLMLNLGGICHAGMAAYGRFATFAEIIM
jgi:hypothetical protein